MNVILSFLGGFESFDLFQMKGERNEAKEKIQGENRDFFSAEVAGPSMKILPRSKTEDQVHFAGARKKTNVKLSINMTSAAAATAAAE